MTTTWADVMSAPTPAVLTGVRSMTQAQRKLTRAVWQQVMADPIWPVAQAWSLAVLPPWRGAVQPGAERAEQVARRAVIASSIARSGWVSPQEARQMALVPRRRPLPTPAGYADELHAAGVWHADAHVRELGELVELPQAGRPYLVEALADWFAAEAMWPCRPGGIPAHLRPCERLWRRVVRPGETAVQTCAARHIVIGTPRSMGALTLDARDQPLSPPLAGVWATWCRLLDPAVDPTDRRAEARVRHRAIRRTELASQPPVLDLLGASREALGLAG